MPKHFKAARLWTVVAAAVLIAGTVSAMGPRTDVIGQGSVTFSTAI